MDARHRARFRGIAQSILSEMKTNTNKPKTVERQPEMEDMTMRDVVAMFFITGLLASGNGHQPIDNLNLGNKLAKAYMKSREEQQ